MAPPIPVPNGSDPRWIWGYYTLIDPATSTPEGYHLFSTSPSRNPFEPVAGPLVTVELCAVADGTVSRVETMMQIQNATWVPPAVYGHADPNVMIWAIWLLGDANFHGQPVLFDDSVSPPAPELPFVNYKIGAIRYNPAEWRYSGVRIASIPEYALSTPGYASHFAIGILDHLIPGLPDLPPR
jgi:hypothetical protein